jgi:hypothetical protein
VLQSLPSLDVGMRFIWVSHCSKVSFFAMLAAWREFAWGALASGFGETLMHPVDTLKTRIQSGQSGVILQVSLGYGILICANLLFM